jgi:hypothetical protein
MTLECVEFTVPERDLWDEHVLFEETAQNLSNELAPFQQKLRDFAEAISQIEAQSWFDSLSAPLKLFLNSTRSPNYTNGPFQC